MVEQKSNFVTDSAFDQDFPITLDSATKRAKVLSNISYEVKLFLPNGNEFYGQVTVEFDYSSNEENIWLDFKGLGIGNIILNKSKTELEFSCHKISLKNL